MRLAIVQHSGGFLPAVLESCGDLYAQSMS